MFISIGKNLSRLFTCIIVAIIFQFPKPDLRAAEPLQSGLAISPVVFELSADPGDTLSNSIKLYNPTENDIQVKMSIEDFTPIGDEGQVVLNDSEGNSTFSMTKWTEISPSNFTIQPKQQQIVNFKIKVPSNGEPGGHYGSIVATISGGGTEVTGSVASSKRGALILLRVSGDIKESLFISEFSTKDFQENGPVDFDIKFNNTGNVHIKPAGFITITNIWGKKVDQIEIEQKNVIPNATRKVEAKWNKSNLFGRYTATLVTNYGNTDKQTISEVKTFTVLPIKKIGIIMAVIFIVLFFGYLYRKRLTLAFKVLIGRQ